LLFADNPLPLWVYDVETLAFLEVNAAAVSKYGYSREEFFRMRISDIRPPEDLERLRNTVATLSAVTDQVRPAPGLRRHRLKDGRLIDVTIVSHAITFAGRRAALVVAIDTTELVRSETTTRQVRRAARHPSRDRPPDHRRRSARDDRRGGAPAAAGAPRR